MQISLITFFITGLIFSVLAIPLIKRKVKMNNWYGIRIPQTTQSENIWYQVNEIMGKYIFSWGIFISILSLYFIFNSTDPNYLMVYILLGILIGGAVLLVVMSYKVANRISLKNYKNRDKYYG